MIPSETEYLCLVGSDGYSKAQRAFELLTNYSKDETIVKVFYLTLTNAYWRGVNHGVDQSRNIVQTAFKKVAKRE